MKLFHLFITASVLLTACGGVNEADFKSQIPESSPIKEVETDDDIVLEADPAKPLKNLDDMMEVEVELPDQINLTASFFSQAPDGDWSQPWQDACEETSLLIAHYSMMDEPLSKEMLKKQVLEMVDWQVETFGYYESTTVEQVAELYEGYFEDSLNFRIIDSPTVDDLKQELATGNLIVAPFAGQMLGNPFYSGEGPYYHMMVLKGYDNTHFITHDVGTRHGENFIYTHDAIMNAMHDYAQTNIQAQPARVIVLEN